MKEKDYQIKFNHWLKEKYKKTGCFELKQTQTNSIPFSSVKEHQIKALLNASNSSLVYKIPDMGYENPFDCFCLSGVPAFVVIKYPKSFELISIESFLFEMGKSKRKSLTYERAKLISTITINYE